MITRRTFATSAAALAAASATTPAFAQQPPVKVGELNSYGRMAAFAVPYRNGLELALAL